MNSINVKLNETLQAALTQCAACMRAMLLSACIVAAAAPSRVMAFVRHCLRQLKLMMQSQVQEVVALEMDIKKFDDCAPKHDIATESVQLVELPLADIELDNDSGSSAEVTDKESDASNSSTPAMSPREGEPSLNRMEMIHLDQVVRPSYANIVTRKLYVKSADIKQSNDKEDDVSWRDQPRMQPCRGRHFSAVKSQRTSANNSTSNSAMHSNAGSRDRSPARRRSLGGDDFSAFGNKLRARLQKLQCDEATAAAVDFDWNHTKSGAPTPKWARTPTLGSSTPKEQQVTTYARGPDGSRGFARRKSLAEP